MPETKPHTRNAVQVLITLPPADQLDLVVLSLEDAEPGMAGNVSRTVRDLIRERMEVKKKRCSAEELEQLRAAARKQMKARRPRALKGQ